MLRHIILLAISAGCVWCDEVELPCHSDEIATKCVNEIRCDHGSHVDPHSTCRRGCQCKDGYARASEGHCVPLERCPCQKHATFQRDVSACPITCANRYDKFHCLAILLAGCACDKGYILNKHGECIPEEDCEVTCPQNLVYSTDGYYRTCEQYLKHEKGTKIKGCICPEGMFFHSASGKCVPGPECSEHTHNRTCAEKSNRLEYKTCAFPNCQPTCDNPNPISCPFEKCKSGCYCKEGYVQKSVTDKRCVRRKECTCPRNAYFTECGQMISKSCENMYQRGRAQAAVCVPKCECRSGFVFNKHGECVRHHHCPVDETKCDGNLKFVLHHSHHRICGRDVPLRVRRGCVCEDGLHYDEYRNLCVRPDECSRPDSNQDCSREDPYREFRACQSSSCVPTCSNPSPTSCTRDCRRGCYCKRGMLQISESDRTCVFPEQCPNVNCRRHEIYSVSKRICPQTCGNRFFDSDSDCSIPSAPGCNCGHGMVRNSMGHCVHPDACHDDDFSEEFECPPNTHFTRTPTALGTCEDSDSSSGEVLYRGCVCNWGLVYDKRNKRCVEPEMCRNSDQDKCCRAEDQHSHFEICANCERTCRNNPIFCTKMCIPGCRCNKGYVRQEVGGKCILEKHCHQGHCGPHSTPTNCENTCALTCRNMNLPGPFCPFVNFCHSGCNCHEGFVKNSEGECVRPINCRRDEVTCPGNSYYDHQGEYALTCNPRGRKLYNCRCHTGFVYDFNARMCVRPSDCSIL